MDNVVELVLTTERKFSKNMIGVNCIICNEFCELDEAEEDALCHGHQVVKACDHCKAAIEWAKTKALDKSI